MRTTFSILAALFCISTANGQITDCNNNGIDDLDDVLGAQTSTIFASNINTPEDIVPSQGTYLPGFFVPDAFGNKIYHISPTGDSSIFFNSAFSFPIGATFVPDGFGGPGEKLIAAFGSAEQPSLHIIDQNGLATPFSTLSGAQATGLVFVPASVSNTFDLLVVTSQIDIYGFRAGSIHLVDTTGNAIGITAATAIGEGLFTPILAPSDFGTFSDFIFVGNSNGPHIFFFDFDTGQIGLFASMGLPVGPHPGMRQMEFSPVGWASSIDIALAGERVLLASIASENTDEGNGGSLVTIWDQRGRLVAALNRGPNNTSIEPRGITFDGTDVLISDLKNNQIIRVSIDDFGFSDCDDDGILDVCELTLDCNSNGIPDECEIDCNLNEIPDECDLVNGASDLNKNLIPDECEPGRAFLGDADEDHDTDLMDASEFQFCLSGPDESSFQHCLDIYDFDNDGDVDMYDSGLFQIVFTGQ